MNRLIQFLFLILGITALVACNDDVTYADQVKRERSAINAYIADSAVSVISEDEFRNNNYTTDVSKNEFVLFQSSGLYLQIIRKGTGSHIATGETARVLCRHRAQPADGLYTIVQHNLTLLLPLGRDYDGDQQLRYLLG